MTKEQNMSEDVPLRSDGQETFYGPGHVDCRNRCPVPQGHAVVRLPKYHGGRICEVCGRGFMVFAFQLISQ
jgi:hypothetical protein